MLAAKGAVEALKADGSQVAQCWKLWNESVPPRVELPAGEELRFRVLVSASVGLSEWSMDGPQATVVQRMVDFFWSVGSPQQQIELLNNTGIGLNPARLGSWTRLSASGGIDAGWAFVDRFDLDLVMRVVPPSSVAQALLAWAASHGVTKCCEVSHDVSGIPPQTTELRMELPGPTAAAQVAVVSDAMARFAVPPFAEEQLELLRQLPVAPDAPLQVVIALTESAVVRVSVYVPAPPQSVVDAMLAAAGGNKAAVDEVAKALDAPTPHYLVLTRIVPGVGHTMYKEGFDVFFGWNVGTEKNC